MIGKRHVSDPALSILEGARVRATLQRTIASATAPSGCTGWMSRGGLLVPGQQQCSGAAAARPVIEEVDG